MFGKKKQIATPIPKLTHFKLIINLTAVGQWIANPTKIKPVTQDGWRDSNTGIDPVTKTYNITLLPSQEFTFYHNDANEFSPAIGGIDTLSNEDIGCVEWSWGRSHFNVNISNPRITIFHIPIDEILYLMQTGENMATNSGTNEDIISLGVDEKYDETCRQRSMGVALTYSNELVAFSIVSASSSDLVSYS